MVFNHKCSYQTSFFRLFFFYFNLGYWCLHKLFIAINAFKFLLLASLVKRESRKHLSLRTCSSVMALSRRRGLTFFFDVWFRSPHHGGEDVPFVVVVVFFLLVVHDLLVVVNRDAACPTVVYIVSILKPTLLSVAVLLKLVENLLCDLIFG